MAIMVVINIFLTKFISLKAGQPFKKGEKKQKPSVNDDQDIPF